MIAPRYLLGAAAILWGWQTGQWAVAIACALALEAPALTTRRVAVMAERQKRIADLALVLTAMVGVGCYIAYGNPRAIVLLFQWLPVLFMPVGLLQVWGGEKAISLDVLFWSLRRQRESAAFHLGYAYFLMWLVGACAANQRGDAGTLALAALGAWALWNARRARGERALWAGEIVLALALGTALHTGLHGAQQWLEGAAPDWMTGSGGTRTNPYRSSTDLGAIGELKQSDAIVLRVATGGPLDTPLLLHRASYNEYGGTSWVARGARFAEVPKAPDGAWVLRSGPAQRTIEVADFAVHGNPVLSLPAGATRIEGAAISLRANNLGAVQAEAAPGFLIYKVTVGERDAMGQPPTPGDLAVPTRERAAIAEALAALAIPHGAPEQAIARVRQVLRENYRYSTSVDAAAPGRTPLADFLERTRAGHCEYFAGATVLLLRAAGVPARYATGFSLQEYDAASRGYLVRERHAHAWARAWLDGAWVDVDTTPPGWAATEDLARPSLARARTAFMDAWSQLRYRYARWQQDSGEAEKWAWFGGIGALVAAWLLWRVFGDARRARPNAGVAGSGAGLDIAATRGNDSAFYAIEAALARGDCARDAAESMVEWVARLRRRAGDADGAALAPLAALHDRYRFDPRGLTPAEAGAFATACAAWLAKHDGGAANIVPRSPAA